MDLTNNNVDKTYKKQPLQRQRPQQKTYKKPTYNRPIQKRQVNLSKEEKEKFKTILESLVGTRGACLLDPQLNVLGKVPVTELESTIKSLKTGVYAIVFDGTIDKNISKTVESSSVKYLIGMNSKLTENNYRIGIITSAEL